MENKGDYINDLNRHMYDEKEVEIVIYHLMKHLKNAFNRKYIFESERSKDNIQKIRNVSDPIQNFLHETFIESESEYYARPEYDSAIKVGRIKRSALYLRYTDFCYKEEMLLTLLHKSLLYF